MEFFRKMSESASLVSGMAERLDVDFADRIASAPESQTRSYAAMVMRCANCDQHENCMALQENNPALDAAPEYCRNGDVFQRAGSRQ